MILYFNKNGKFNADLKIRYCNIYILNIYSHNCWMGHFEKDRKKRTTNMSSL
jgi:hypothetical protein